MKDSNSPIQVQLVEGTTYHWCKCGKSKTGAFCDGTEGAGCEAVSFVAHKTETANLCGCRETDDPPYCDGTHNIL